MFDFGMLFDLQLQGRIGLRHGLYELLPVHAALQNTDDGLPSACVQVFEHTIPCCSTHQVFVHDLRKHMQIVNCHGREGRYVQGQKLLEVIFQKELCKQRLNYLLQLFCPGSSFR